MKNCKLSENATKIDWKILTLGLLIAIIVSMCIQHITAKEVLNRVIEKYDKAEGYKALIHIITKNREYYVRVAFKKPDKLRVENPQTLTIVNDSKLLIYNKTSSERKVLYVGSSTPVDLYYGFFLNILKRSNVSLAGEERVNGKLCYVITSKGGYGNVRVDKVWVTRDWIIAKMKISVKLGTNNASDIFEYKVFEFGRINNSLFKIENSSITARSLLKLT